MGFLDNAGLAHLWDKLKTKFIFNRNGTATLSSTGWYRVADYIDPNMAAFSIHVTITADYDECYDIDFIYSDGQVNNSDDYAFYDERSHGSGSTIQKIRYTTDNNYGHIDIYYDSSSSTDVTVTIDVKSDMEETNKWRISSFDSVAAAPSGETAQIEYSFTQNSAAFLNKVIGKSLWSGTWTSGNITVNELKNYNIFIVKVQRTSNGNYHACNIYASIGNDNTDEYFRGIGGYPDGSNSWVNYYINAEFDGNNKLTMVNCISRDNSGSAVQMSVREIIGVI